MTQPRLPDGFAGTVLHQGLRQAAFVAAQGLEHVEAEAALLVEAAQVQGIIDLGERALQAL